jgi:hypothetical protein
MPSGKKKEQTAIVAKETEAKEKTSSPLLQERPCKKV